MFQCIYAIIFLFFSFCICFEVHADPNFAVSYQGRFRSAEAYSRLWLYEYYHKESLEKADLTPFQTDSSSAFDFLMSLNLRGYKAFQQAPLFFIDSKLKSYFFHPSSNQKRLSYLELKEVFKQNQSASNEFIPLRDRLKNFESIQGMTSSTEIAFQNRFQLLQNKNLTPQEIAALLERDFPLRQRLQQAGSLFHSLPSRIGYDWYPLQSLGIRVYSSQSNELQSIENFTLFSDDDFKVIQNRYLLLTEAINDLSSASSIREKQADLIEALEHAYQSIAGHIYKKGHEKALFYPTLWQLKLETFYVSYPWINFLIGCYLLSFIAYSTQKLSIFSSKVDYAKTLFVISFIFHTSILLIRMIILDRPPVSNMFETVLYVPWIAVAMSVGIPIFRKNKAVSMCACLIAIGLLTFSELTYLNQNLDAVQAVLDSRFWLTIHVLLIVASYGVFILGSALAHVYFTIFLARPFSSPFMLQLGSLILQTMYFGTALLIVGTILGGVWAAQSWGRFWDWDPKESWAFISSCFYLIFIHAYRFRKIGFFGISLGAIIGFLVISFTWYGVNYLLGTGLHSYGFSSGGEKYYCAFLIGELMFMSYVIWKAKLTHCVTRNK